MTPDKHDRKLSPVATEERLTPNHSTQQDKNSDWISDLERELEEISQKWPFPRSFT